MQTKRLELRLLKKSDSQAFLAAVSNSHTELDPFLTWAKSMHSEQDATDHIRDYILQEQIGNGGLWGIFERSNKTLLGALYLHFISESNSSCAIGYWLATPYIGKGFATEALQAFCSLLFSQYGLNRIEVHTATTNLRSKALLQRIHFQEEGVCREYEKINETFQDHYRFALLKKDFTTEVKGNAT